MFGYVTVNHKILTKEDTARYQSLYCGLCKRLGDLHGGAGRMTLAYDMVFLSMLLSSLYREEESGDIQRCPVHPLRKHEYIYSAATDYSADLSLILAYYKCIDDWNDDHSAISLKKSKVLQKGSDVAAARWPRQHTAIANGLARLEEMERVNEMNPDLPANCFGAIIGELFVREDDEYSAALRRMGSALGRFVYMMDAANDLREDIKKERYNPLISLTDTDFAPILSLLIGECMEEFDAFPLDRDVSIMQNILYSGIWMKYTRKERAE